MSKASDLQQQGIRLISNHERCRNNVYQISRANVKSSQHSHLERCMLHQASSDLHLIPDTIEQTKVDTTRL